MLQNGEMVDFCYFGVQNCRDLHTLSPTLALRNDPDSIGTWGTIGGWWGTMDLGGITDGCNRWGAIGGWWDTVGSTDKM